MSPGWRPRPIDTGGVRMPPVLACLTELLAENAHDTWGQQRLLDGWRYGPERDDEAKTHPLLVAYRDLPDDEKVYDRRLATETIKVILRLGYRIERPSPTVRSTAMRPLLARFRIAISVALFLLGIAVMLAASTGTGLWWGFLGNIGMFVAAAVAIPFYYEVVLRDHERMAVKEELGRLLDDRLNERLDVRSRCRIHPGRWSVDHKRVFIQRAATEVCEIGISLRSLVSYFDQRPDSDFLIPVRDLLARGVNFTYILMDPDAPGTTAYAHVLGDPALPDRIRASVERLQAVAAEFAAMSLPGRMSVSVTRAWPSANVILVDPDGPAGRCLVAPYLFGMKRAAAPVLELSQDEQPESFAKYADHWRAALDTAKPPRSSGEV